MKKVFLILLVLSSPVFAQENKLLVADASSSGTYAQMMKEIMSVCSTPESGLMIEEVKVSGGATENLAALKNNRASAALMHSDVIYAMSASDASYRQLKTLVALYQEEVHILAKRTSGIKTGTTLGYGGRVVEFNTLGDLRGYTVGAAGGGVITAKILQGNGEAGFKVQAFDTGKEVMAALEAGQIQAAVFVGGAPLKMIEDLNGSQYKLLPVPEGIRARVANIYQPATINYPNMRSGPVATIAPDAIVLTRVYKSPKMIAPQAAFRRCFLAHLDELKEVPNMHSKWQQVEADNHGKWEWYEIPGEVGPPAAAESFGAPAQGHKRPPKR
jgi:TRAP-type uncharacterized transport system substrate-binding protein